MTAGSLYLDGTRCRPFSLFELDGLATELDGHDDLPGRVSLPPGPDRPLLGHRLPLTVDLGPALDGADVDPMPPKNRKGGSARTEFRFT
jgi:hypothetical protein